MIIKGNNGDLIIVADGQAVLDNTADTFGPYSGSLMLYADYRDIIFNLVGGTNTSSSLSGITINLDQNIINLGSGNKIVYGNVRDIKMSALGGVADDGGAYFNLMDGNTITMAGNIITAGGGSNEVYGNMRDFTMSIGGNTAKNGSSSVNEITGSTFNMGNNQITLASGNNTVFGVMRDLKIDIMGSTAIDVGSTAIAGVGDIASFYGLGDTLDPNSFNLAGNHITVGNGKNVIYGDMQSLKVTIKDGSAIASPFSDAGFNVSTDNEVTYFNITMESNIIVAGNGCNVIFGNLGDLTSLTSGGLLDGGNLVFKGFFGNEISMAGNQITVGNGSNVIYGNLHDIVFTKTGGIGTNLDPFSPYVVIQSVPSGSNNYSMGGNTITTGNGCNEVYGTLHDIIFKESGGYNTTNLTSDYPTGFILRDTYNMGWNIITTGNGLDIIYGDMHDMNFYITGGTGVGGPTETMGFGAFNLISSETFTMGHNTISAGDGNNIVYGCMNNLSMTGIGGTASGFAFGIIEYSGNKVTMGNNDITTGNGRDVVYGDLHDLSLLAQGGTATGAGAFAVGIFRNGMTFNLGNNIINTGDGADTIYGNMHALSLSAIGGTVINAGVQDGQSTTAEALLQRVSATMVGNHIESGSGNDVIFGNMEILNFSTLDGTVVSGVSGKAGGYLSGPWDVPAAGEIFVDKGSTMTFGNDVIDAGSGNDFLSGDALNLNGLDAFLVKAQPGYDNINLIDWGNDVLTGGSGSDEFVESLDNHTGNMTMQGADIITDFTLGTCYTAGDRLVFGNVMDVNGDGNVNAKDLDMVSTFVDFMVNGQNQVAIIFHGTGSDSNLASLYQQGINALIALEAPGATTLDILEDVAQYIYQSGTASNLTGAGNVRDATTFVVLPATGETLASDVSAANAPLGAVILQNHTAASVGSSFAGMTSLAPSALEIHSDTASIHPWG